MATFAARKIRISGYANAFAVVAAAEAGAVLIGWALNVQFLKCAGLGALAMNPTTAMTFLLATAALGVFVYHRKSRRRSGYVLLGRLLAMLVAMIGVLKLVSLASSSGDTGIDTWLFRSKLLVVSGLPNRMAANTAFNFVLIGCALFLLHFRRRRVSRWAFAFAFGCGLEALLSVIGYAYRVQAFYEVGSYIPMAFPTAIVFLLLVCSIISYQADRGFGALVASNNAGGRMARRLLPAAILMPAILGWLRIEGERMGLYDSGYGAALYTVTIMILFAALVCRSAQSIFRKDEERTKAELQLRRTHDELEARVKERTEELSNANNALRTAWGELEERVRERTARLADTESRLCAIVDNAPSVIYVKDLDGKFVLVNQSFCRLLGKQEQEIIGRTGYDLYPKEKADVFRTNDDAALRAGVPVETEETLTQSDGMHIFISSKFPLRDAAGAVYGLCGISTDITDRKRAGQALEEAKEEAERANRAKSEFLSRMSHELRTPMNAILGFAQLLELDELTPDQRVGVGHILRGGDHLLDLINEVLDIARIEAGRMSLSCEPVAAAEVLSEAIELVQNLAVEADVLISTATSDDCFIFADRQRLKQVLINLTSNAIKYNRKNGKVTIQCKTTAHRVRIAITDTGIGIPAARLKQLFTPFERLGAEQSSVEGTGLGLAVTKRLVEAMDGTIGVQTTAGQGSTFWIELPRAESQLDSVEIIQDAVEAATANGPRRTVLYIEDNLSNFELLERLLRRWPSINLIAARTGLEGLSMAREHTPDLVLLDVNLPDMDGRDVLLCIHADPICASLPVVVISADATPRQIDRLMAAGAVEYLTKPLDVKHFLSVLEENLLATAPG